MSHYPREISQFRAISHMDELHNLDFLGLTAGSSDSYPYSNYFKLLNKGTYLLCVTIVPKVWELEKYTKINS